MRIAFFDCFAGISGNMVLGALLDAGLDREKLEEELVKLGLSGYQIHVQSVHRRGLHGTHVEVEVSEKQPTRHLRDIEATILESTVPEVVKEHSLAIFRRLAEAEARVHGSSIEAVHFHEVGAVDAIIDVVGAALGLWLLGVEKVYASAVHVGRGTVECAHGTLPVPAPATLELLRGVPIYGRDIDSELVTPTGAAILATLAQTFGDAPPMKVAAIGYGAGTRELPLPNLLRLTIGETGAELEGFEEDSVTLIETNIDDMNPQWYEHVMEQLFDAGALDVFLTPIQMKHNRPAIQISVIVPMAELQAVLSVLFTETTTIGVRTSVKRRWKLQRERILVQTPLGAIHVKVSRRGRQILNLLPEHRDCQKIATERRVPLKEVHQVALESARSHLQSTSVEPDR
jgi:uncharacterized protein (TIGR00299 family) protein